MLDDQWFAIATGTAHSIIDERALPGPRSILHLAAALEPITILHGSSVLVEETDDTYSFAVGDTRRLDNLRDFKDAGPERHAVICVVNKQTQQIRVVTDRINFAKVFWYKIDGGLVLSTHLTFFDKGRLPLSMTGLACAIANGTSFDDRTIFRDVTVLERSSVHEFREGRHTERIYWSYAVDPVGMPRAQKQRLKDALVDSVRDQVCEHPLLLSLSGGFDSSGILGILAKYAKPKSLKTFSYVSGTPVKGTDAAVAQQMAALVGYPHAILQAYDGDLVETIRQNARLGQSISNFCDEIDAWQRQGLSEAGAIVLAGDECFGWSDRRFVSTDDVLISICLRNFEFAGAVVPLLDPAVRAEMTNGLGGAIDQILEKSRTQNLHDMKDGLYLDHRIQWGLLPWRRFVIGEHFAVREPLLQTRVLEVTKTLPTEDRIGKALYREAIQELVPEIFSIPRARTGQAIPAWGRELERNRTRIEEMLKTPSALDQVIDPAVIAKMLSTLGESRSNKNWKMVVRQMVGPAAARAVRKFVRPEAPRFQSTPVILIRLLVLREFLASRQQV